MECPNCKTEIDEGLTVCTKCNQSLIREKTSPKNYWMANLSAYCVLAVAAFYAFFIIFAALGSDVEGFVGEILAAGALGLFAASPLLAVLALVRIYRSNETLGGKKRAINVIVGTSFFLVLLAPMIPMQTRIHAERVVCVSNLKALGIAVQVYANNYGDTIPVGNWCDVLVSKCDISPNKFDCRGSDGRDGESSYALNKNAAGKKLSDLPQEMVLLFETSNQSQGKRRFPISQREFASHVNKFEFEKHESDNVYELNWNQIGSPEILEVNNHTSRGCNILFVNGDVRFIKLEDLPGLLWSADGKEDFPAQLFSHERGIMAITSIAVVVIEIVFLIMGLFVVYKYLSKKHILFALILGLFSGGVGCFFGLGAEELYRVRDSAGFGMTIGGIFGLIIGVCYVAILTATSSPINNQKSFKRYAIALGMAAGIICSTIVHLNLMVMHEENRPWAMIAGLPFGIIAGSILGAISGSILKRNYPVKAVEADAVS